MVTAPTPVTTPVHKGVAPARGVILATRYKPAFTMVAECRYALTGVGAVMAFGSQK
jgi:NADH:ubiquinone oxidoreductase subunit 5 (subunit L)/multisubunit Na+/H+ antiporter MnhA subunit